MRVDAFRVGGTTFEEDRATVQYKAWAGFGQAQAFGGSYRSAGTSASVFFTTMGSQFTWITAKGPKYGKAQVIVDGTVVATVDLYTPAQQWLSPVVINGLNTSTHQVQIKVLGTRNSASIGNIVVFDAVSVP